MTEKICKASILPRLAPSEDCCSPPLSLCCRAASSQGGFVCLRQEFFSFSRSMHWHYLILYCPGVARFENSAFSVTIVSSTAPLWGANSLHYLGRCFELMQHSSELIMIAWIIRCIREFTIQFQCCQTQSYKLQ